MPTKLHPSPILNHRLPACLEGIRRHFCDFGIAPSYSELSARIRVRKHQIPGMLRKLHAAGSIIYTGGERGIMLPRSLSARSNSELLWELQARGLPVAIGAQGTEPPLKSAWPEAWIIDEGQVTKDELLLLAKLDDIPGTSSTRSGGQHGSGSGQQS